MRGKRTEEIRHPAIVFNATGALLREGWCRGHRDESVTVPALRGRTHCVLNT